MPPKTGPETPIERIFREVTGRKMPASVRRVLLPSAESPRAKLNPRSSESCVMFLTDFRLTFVI